MQKLKSDHFEFVICSHCSSTEYIKDYPSPGKLLCTECGHESEIIILKFIDQYKELFDSCSFCGTDGDDDD